jgi:hypothetical protein
VSALFVFDSYLGGWSSSFLNWLLSRLNVLALKNLIQTLILGDFDHVNQYILRQSVLWGAMRCVSFGHLLAAEHPISLSSALGFYCYLPTIFLGPFHTYEIYERGVMTAAAALSPVY